MTTVAVVEVLEEAIHTRRFQVFANAMNRLELKIAALVWTSRHRPLVGIGSAEESLVFVGVVIVGARCVLASEASTFIVRIFAR